MTITMIIVTIIGVLWLIPGVYLLYKIDFSSDLKDGFGGAITIVGVTLLILILGPLVAYAYHSEIGGSSK